MSCKFRDYNVFDLARRPCARLSRNIRVLQPAMPIIESIPNISEGRRPEVVARIVGAVRGTPGVRVLDHSSDASHNRSVITIVGDRTSLKAAVLALYEAAV